MLDNPNKPGSVGAAHEAFDLREWMSFAWRHWKFIAAITAIVLVVGTAYLLNQTRLYTATAQVLLDPQKEKMPGGDAMLAELRLSLAVIDSQIAIIRSTVFLRRVVERAHLVPTASVAANTASAADETGLFGAARGFVLGLIGSWRADGQRSEDDPAGAARRRNRYDTGARTARCRGSQRLAECRARRAAGLRADDRGYLTRSRRSGSAGQCGRRDISGR